MSLPALFETTLRKASLMNRREVCAAPAACAILAVPTAAATKPAEGIDYDAIRERLVLVVETFSRATVGFPETMPVDEAAAILSLSDAELNNADALIPFAHKWGVCLDWLIEGDLAPLLRDGRRAREMQRSDADPAAAAFEEWQAAIVREAPLIDKAAAMRPDDPGEPEAWEEASHAGRRVEAELFNVTMQDATTPAGIMGQVLAMASDTWGTHLGGDPRRIDGYFLQAGDGDHPGVRALVS
ncbi:MAG: hypothetical protein AAF913_15765, partial [Pseudomonadota bacterium]